MKLKIIQQIVDLVAVKGKMEESLTRLNKMRGTYQEAGYEKGTYTKTEVDVALCTKIQFDSHHTASVSTHDTELNTMLVEVAVKYHEEKLEAINKLLYEAEERLTDI